MVATTTSSSHLSPAVREVRQKWFFWDFGGSSVVFEWLGLRMSSMNRLTEYYRLLLGLDAAWEVSGVALCLEGKRVEISLKHLGEPSSMPGVRRGVYDCRSCSAAYPATSGHDAVRDAPFRSDARWRTANPMLPPKPALFSRPKTPSRLSLISSRTIHL